VDQEVGGSNPPNCTNNINHLDQAIRPELKVMGCDGLHSVGRSSDLLVALLVIVDALTGEGAGR
jgi:hypothetical protein